MAAYGVNFESANSIKSRKESKREERERVIQKAKEKFEKEERRKAERKARGEDTWMLPDVDLRLQQIGEEHTVKTKKAKKEKKAKKSKKEKKKKAKKEKKDEGDASCDSSEDSEDEWVEATQPSGGKDKSLEAEPEATPSSSSASNNQRDEWMTFDFLAMKTTSVADRRAQKEAEKEAERQKAQAIEQAGLHRLELNPYWKDGGSGLPPEESSSTAVKKAGVVNDGGVSWLRKSYQRMKEQADREQRSLDSVVAERYGSMEEFQKRLKEAEDAAYGERRDDEKERGRREKGKESWRRNDREEGREQWRRDEEKDRWRRNDRDEGRERWRGDEDKERWRKDGWRRGEREDRRRERSPNAERERARSRDDLSSKFLKPSEDDEVSRGAGFKKGSSSNQSAAFRKPVDDVEMSREAGFKKGSSSNENAAFRKPVDDDDEMSRGTAFKKGSSSNQSAAFRKPVDGDDDDDDDEMSRGAEFRKSSSSNQSAAFRKPIDNNNEGRGVAAAWRKSSAVKDSERPTLQKHTEKSAALQEDSKTTTTVSSSESEEEEEEELILTDEEMNKLGAKIVKAEIMGNTALLEKLRAQMEAARRAKEKRAQIKDQSKQASEPAVSEKEVLLFRTDPSGRAWPVNAPSETLEPRGGRRKRKAIETHQDGERVRYFDDDDGVDLREMVRREKMSSAEDQNALYSRMAAKMMGRTDGDNYTLDDMFVSSAAQKERAGRDEERQRNKAVQETRRLAGRMEKCPHCFDSAELPKHLIIAVGTKVYLCLPNSVSLTEGHCLIVPVQHHTAATGLDEDIWGEIQMFRRALVRMFESQELDCVFLETHMNPKRHLHMVYECVPMPRELGDMAPIYFKKAIMESDEEWAMNKKVVDLSKRDIRQAVPRGLPYFSVDFGLQGGFAHVIENEQKFPHYFGKEILGGMLDLEPRRWRKPIRENFDDQRKKVLKFAQWWKPFDCTKSDS
ncbi:CWF19-like protein 2 [Danio rerio]|uniref:CWF19-like protein 2 n=1 Tax=Danio rerio TaxID=7955 RepID=A0A0R4I9L2_DANRE|nr:CWF19-like protein 2 [Danio rerio]|eukprot:NP_001028924.2 CWF19-like protein 2 [Danio rerio]